METITAVQSTNLMRQPTLKERFHRFLGVLFCDCCLINIQDENQERKIVTTSTWSNRSMEIEFDIILRKLIRYIDVKVSKDSNSQEMLTKNRNTRDVGWCEEGESSRVKC